MVAAKKPTKFTKRMREQMNKRLVTAVLMNRAKGLRHYRRMLDKMARTLLATGSSSAAHQLYAEMVSIEWMSPRSALRLAKAA